MLNFKNYKLWKNRSNLASLFSIYYFNLQIPRENKKHENLFKIFIIYFNELVNMCV